MRTILVVAAALAGFVATAAAAAPRPEVSDIRVGVHGERTRLVIETNAPADHSVFTLSTGGDRLVVDLEPVGWGVQGAPLANGQQAVAGAGVVRQARFADNSPTTSRIVFDLSAPVAIAERFEIAANRTSRHHRLVIDVEAADGAAPAAPATAPSRPQPAARAAAPARTERASARDAGEQTGRRKYVIVIDPGRGGADPGAIGRARGVLEKDVTLEIARELRAALTRSSRYSVVMTRNDDTYVEHLDRVRIAREADADLFISLHADSTASGRRVRGASVYTLAERARERAFSTVLEDDDRVFDVELEGRSGTVRDTLVRLAQNHTTNQSAQFAEMLIPRLGEVGPLLNNTHRNAGFFVLLAPDVPAVLLETGYLSNTQDEARLGSARERRRIANAIADSIDAFFVANGRRVAQR